MPIGPGTYTFGPDSATLTVRTTRRGAAGKAGHDLEMELTNWNATLELGDNSSASLTADSSSFRVINGTGGAKPLGAEEKRAIPQTINEEILMGTPIEFHSTRVQPDRGGHSVDIEGELELMGERRTVKFTLNAGFDGRLAGSTRVTQTQWGMEPYTALFGTLKVADDVEVEMRASARS